MDKAFKNAIKLATSPAPIRAGQAKPVMKGLLQKIAKLETDIRAAHEDVRDLKRERLG